MSNEMAIEMKEAKRIPVAAGVTATPGTLTQQMVAEVQMQASIMRDIKKAILSITNGDTMWNGFGRKPYLNDAGIEAVAALVRFVFGKPQFEVERVEDAKGLVIYYHCTLDGWMGGQQYWDIGSCSTRDQFFSRSHGKDLPIESIDLGNIRKAAHTNAKHRLLVSTLGIDGMTWEDLATVGLRPGPEGTVVRFRGTERAQTTGAGEWTEAKNRLCGLILELAQGDEEGARQVLFELTNFPDKHIKGLTDPQQLTNAQVARLLIIVEKRLAERDAQMPAEPQAREPGAEG